MNGNEQLYLALYIEFKRTDHTKFNIQTRIDKKTLKVPCLDKSYCKKKNIEMFCKMEVGI